jgi:cell pole-organizing protein PopZ
MGMVANEPSMEDILSSIKRIIADGSERVSPARSLRRRGSGGRDESDFATSDEDADIGAETSRQQGMGESAEDGDPAILELTDMVEEPIEMNDAAVPTRKATAKTAPQPQVEPKPVEQEDMILSDLSAQAARHSLSQLSSLLVRPQESESNTLEGLVREMLRPMLKEWLEASLPDLVQGMVKKEIDRIVGRLG